MEPSGRERETGPVESFEDVFAREFRPLYGYLRRRVNASQAEELAEATFATAYASWERHDPDRPIRPWLYGIAANLLRHHWRSERRMLRAYARTGADPVTRVEETAVEQADAELRYCVHATARSSSCTAGRSSRTPRSRQRSTSPSARSSPGSTGRARSCGTKAGGAGNSR
jgi:DNA-directed RNA polymerase specialized sigma24 family protein